MSTARSSTPKESSATAKGFSVANVVLLLITFILLIITVYKYNAVETLKEFQEQQDVRADKIEEACDWMTYTTAKYTAGQSSDECEAAINQGKSDGVVSQVCENGYYTLTEDHKNSHFDFLYQKEPGAEVPSKADDNCELAADKCEMFKAEAYIIPACNSMDKIYSQQCKNAEALFNNEFKAVLCYGNTINGLPKSFRTYVAYSKDIYDDEWHYTYTGYLDPHAGEECTW